MLPIRDHLPTRTPAIVNYAIIAANLAVFVLEASRAGGGDSVERWALVPARLLANPAAAAPTLLTHMFLHGGFSHVAGNMLFLWIFGDNVEDFYGHITYLFFYLLCGIGSGLLHVLFNMNSTVPALGASGAISGVMGAYAILYPRSRILTLVFVFLVPIPAVLILGCWFILQFLSAFGSLGAVGSAASGGVAWWAHVGGFLLGMLITIMARGQQRSARWQSSG